MEKDRKQNQNGKGSDSRITDIKRYKDNFNNIDWSAHKKEKNNSNR